MEALLLKDVGFNKINSKRDGYLDIPLVYQISYALSQFYDLPKNTLKPVPPEWNPVLIFYTAGLFDPNMMGPQGTITEELWEPWPDAIGVEKTKEYANSIKEFIAKCDQYKDQKPLYRGERGWPTILYNHFVLTREVITNKTIILGFYHLETGRFRRYLIKDVKKLCKVLRVTKGDFPRLLGKLDPDESGIAVGLQPPSTFTDLIACRCSTFAKPGAITDDEQKRAAFGRRNERSTARCDELRELGVRHRYQTSGHADVSSVEVLTLELLKFIHVERILGVLTQPATRLLVTRRHAAGHASRIVCCRRAHRVPMG